MPSSITHSATTPTGSVPGAGKLKLVTMASLDGRTRAARTVRDLVASIETDLGGTDEVSAMQAQLVRRAAVLGALLESQEAGWAAGGGIDATEYLPALNAQRRVLHTLGLARKARKIPQDLRAYLASKDKERGTSQTLD